MIESLVNKSEVIRASTALKKLNEKYYEDFSKKKPLLESESSGTVFLQVALKKVPKTKLIKVIHVDLPHSLVRGETEICLITGDLDKRNHKAEIEPDILHYKELLKKHGITQISEIVTLRQLRTEYKPYEAKQKLMAAYDMFLCDNKITECLPRVLGRHFFKKRKFPIQINLKTQNLKQQIERVLCRKQFYFTGHGDCCTSEVAYLDMDDKEITENVSAMVKTLSEKLPGQISNIKGIYIKTAKSKSIPLYMSYDDEANVQDDIVVKDVEFDELTTLPNKMVKVFSDGTVKTVRVTDDKVETLKKIKRKRERIDDTDVSNIKSSESVEEGKKKKSKLSVLDKCDSVVDETNSCIKPNKDEVNIDQSNEEKKQSKKAKRKNKADLPDQSIDVADQKDHKKSDVCIDVLNDSTKPVKSKKEGKVELYDLSEEVPVEKDLVNINKMNKKKQLKKTKGKGFDGASDMTESLKFNESVLSDESTKERKQSKKTKRKAVLDQSTINNFMEDNKEDPTLNEFANVLDETTKEKKQSKKDKNKFKLQDSDKDLNNEESSEKNSEIPIVTDDTKKLRKAKSKNKVELQVSNNDLSNKGSPSKYDEISCVYDETKKEKKSKKGENKVESPNCSNHLSNKESPSKFIENTTTHAVAELPERKTRSKKNENVSESLCDNSNLHGVGRQMKKGTRQRKENLEKVSKKKLSVSNIELLEKAEKETKKLQKRKRNEPELVGDCMKDDGNRTPPQIKKKPKRENVNKIQSIAMKEAVQARKKMRESRLRKGKQ